MTLNGSCRGAGLEKSALGKPKRGRIVTSVVENVGDDCRDRQRCQRYLPTPRDCVARDYAKTTTDITLEQYIQTGHPREFP